MNLTRSTTHHIGLITVLLFNVACISASRADEVYVFNGICADCSNAKGVLTLENYVPGTPVAATNFVSFAYNSSVLNGLYADASLDFGIYSGPNELPEPGAVSSGQVDFAIQWTDPGTNKFYTFFTQASGTWILSVANQPVPPPPGHGGTGGGGDTTALDFGSSYTFALQNTDPSVPSVPLPPSAPLFGAALLAAGGVGYGLKRKATA